MKTKAKKRSLASPHDDKIRPQSVQKRRRKLSIRSQSKIEICILAGGLASRMGRDKSKLRLGRKTFLTHIRNVAKNLEFPVRVIRHDLIPRCGPLGGIFTALQTTSTDAVLFLACDMPQISHTLLAQLLDRYRRDETSLFTWVDDMAGFPFLITRDALPIIEQLILEKAYSLQNLSLKTRARKFHPGSALKSELININTPDDLKELKSSRKNG